MEAFLKAVATDLYNKLGSAIQDITIIYPNHRASLFFNKYLSELTSRPLWQPKTSTISELMHTTAQLKPADPLLLCYKLYNQYIKSTSKSESLDDFYFWGNTMLTDFDQIDKYLVDSRKIFTNINDIKEIDRRFDEFDEEQREALKNFLNLMSEELDSTIRSRYSQIWEKLGSIYSNFTESLIAEGISYEGLAYRVAASKLQQCHESQFNEQFVIVGFNALNSCEKVLFNHLKTYCNALFYWDYDNYYMQAPNSSNEAATFMSDNLKQFPNQLCSEHFNNFNNKNINLIAAPSKIAQAKIIPQILTQLTTSSGQIGMNTAIILPDEELLLPVLSALPTNLQQINITMAYPIRITSAYSLVDYLLGLQQNARKGANSTRFYFKDVLNILGHPYVKQLTNGTDKIVQQIAQQKLITVEAQDISTDKVLSKIFSPIDNVQQIVKYLGEIISEIAANISSDTKNESKNRLEQEFLFAMYKTLNRIDSILPQISTELTIKTIRAFFRKAMNEQRVSFIGEPLTGLQVMGFLETRNLDFENIIILSMNDGTLPGSSHSPSFILPSLRTAYGLPNYKHQNAMFAYYFYRSIQRAKNVNLIYINKDEGMKSGEKSRYILQLLIESNLRINKIEAKFSIGQTPEPEIRIEKTKEILHILNKFVEGNEANKYLSPTSLAVYKNCPLQFFFKKVARFEQPDQMDEAVDERGIGTILHRAIELIYSTIEGTISEEKVKQLLKNKKLINESVIKAFAETYKCAPNRLDDIMIGRNKLTLERIQWMVGQMISIDIQRTPYSIFSHEKLIDTSIPITIGNSTFNVRIGGFADRIENANGKYRIVDFKTGSYNDRKDRFKEVADLFATNELDGVFQLFVYSEVFAKINKVDPSCISQNLWFVRKKQLPLLYQLGNKRGDKFEIESYSQFHNEFFTQLTNLITEIYDPEVCFTQTEDTKMCLRCNYSSICGR